MAAGGGRLANRESAAGRYRFALTGFTSSDVTVLDITDPAHAVAIDGIEVSSVSGDEFQVTFEDTASPITRYVAFTDAAAPAPAEVSANRSSAWRSPSNGADYVIIVHPLFADAIRPLAEHRAAQGLRVATVLIDDVYDEFAHGVFDPRATRAFLEGLGAADVQEVVP